MSEYSRIIKEMRETALGLHAAGAIDKRRMREDEAIPWREVTSVIKTCLPPAYGEGAPKKA